MTTPHAKSNAREGDGVVLDALKSARQFIENGVALGYIRLPEPPDTALQTLPKIEAAIAAMQAQQGAEPVAFAPHWPEGLTSRDVYELKCDDKGRRGGSWLRVIVAEDGDVWLSMQEWEDIPNGEPNPIPGIRCRTWAGGGRNSRSHQALLWLAQAMRLDAEDRKPYSAPATGAPR